MPDPITLSQTWIINWAAGMVAFLPISYAFGAGMVSTVNPCGFAMLPAYLSLYLGTGEETFEQRSFLVRSTKAIYIGGMVTLGFVVLFGLVGIGIAVGGQFLMKLTPWTGLATGVMLAAMGILLLSGKHFYSGFAARLATHVNSQGTIGARAFFLFGIGYAIASLSCTLPIFLVVVGSSIMAGGILAGFYQFISYALGMGLVLIILTLGMALFKSTVVRSFRVVLPYVERVSAVLILLMGFYLIYYWLIKAGLLARYT